MGSLVVYITSFDLDTHVNSIRLVEGQIQMFEETEDGRFMDVVVENLAGNLVRVVVTPADSGLSLDTTEVVN